jgi:hypothetical protein
MVNSGSRDVNRRDELRDELLAVTSARRELSPDEDKYLVESFLDRLDEEIEARVDARIDARLVGLRKQRGGMEPWVVPAALGITIPIVAIAGSAAGGPGILFVLIFVIAVLGIYAEYSGRR